MSKTIIDPEELVDLVGCNDTECIIDVIKKEVNDNIIKQEDWLVEHKNNIENYLMELTKMSDNKVSLSLLKKNEKRYICCISSFYKTSVIDKKVYIDLYNSLDKLKSIIFEAFLEIYKENIIKETFFVKYYNEVYYNNVLIYRSNLYNDYSLRFDHSKNNDEIVSTIESIEEIDGAYFEIFQKHSQISNDKIFEYTTSTYKYTTKESIIESIKKLINKSK